MLRQSHAAVGDAPGGGGSSLAATAAAAAAAVVARLPQSAQGQRAAIAALSDLLRPPPAVALPRGTQQYSGTQQYAPLGKAPQPPLGPQQHSAPPALARAH